MRKHNQLKPGTKFGRLTVVSYSGNSDWLCLCSCGVEKNIKYSSLFHGSTKSCGCYRRDYLIKKQTTHGMKGTKFYGVWMSIKDRCYNSKMLNYKYYGGRGIKMCKRWFKFENFKEDMYKSYLRHSGKNKNTRLDRVNNDGNYLKSNCQWLTHKENCNKTSHCRNITYNGKTKTLSEWSELLGINYDKLENRINRAGWSIDRAFNIK